MQDKNYSFSNQSIFIGIDVHLKTWRIAVLTERGYKEEFSQESQASVLLSHLNKKYPQGIYYSVYESDFTGFSTHYQLLSYGINNIIINASDVPSSQKERIHKSDRVDAMKLAKALKHGDLQGLRILSPEECSFRESVRYRATLVKEASRWKNRIKSYLYRNGIDYPECFKKRGSHWSSKFLLWLREVADRQFHETLQEYMDYYALIRDRLLSIYKKIRQISQDTKYAQQMELLMSIPGIGFCTAITFISEMGNVNYFKNEREFASFIGIVPMSHSSGDKDPNLEMTFRGNKHMRNLLIEASWIAIRKDPALNACYGNLVQRMEENNAIIRIAHKLSNRILSVLKTGKKYVNEKNDQ